MTAPERPQIEPVLPVLLLWRKAGAAIFAQPEKAPC
jgi:hypothetical protein